MNRVALLLGIWLFAFAATLVALVRSTPSEEARGRVVMLAENDCDLAVVQADGGFLVLRRVAGVLNPAVDDEVVGPLHLSGVRSFRVPGRGAISAEVDGRAADRTEAERMLGENCRPALLPRALAGPDLLN
jgi:hypothetical protein